MSFRPQTTPNVLQDVCDTSNDLHKLLPSAIAQSKASFAESTPTLVAVSKFQKHGDQTQQALEEGSSIFAPTSSKNVTPSLSKNNYQKFCYRHNPEVKRTTRVDEDKMRQIQNSLEKLPIREQEAISNVWSLFSAAPSHHRTLMLQGLLTQCCFPQLSMLSEEVSSLIKIDFITALPSELSLKILCYLDCASLCNAAQVSTKWKKLADDDRVWHHMCEQHIDKKCPQCGWGLPLMLLKRAREMPTAPSAAATVVTPPASGSEAEQETTVTKKRKNNSGKAEPATDIDMVASSSSNSQQQAVRKTRPWKIVYSERYKVERNWRKGIYKAKEFQGHEDGVTCIQFDDQFLMTGSYDKTVKIWNVNTGELLRTLEGHNGGIKALVFDDQKLITGGLDSTIKVWNHHTGQCISTYRGHAESVLSVDFHNKTIVSGSADHTVKVWHVETRTCYSLRGHTEWVTCVKIHPKSNTIFSASDDSTVRMWDMSTNQCIRIFGGFKDNGHIGQVQCVIPLTIKDALVEDEKEGFEEDTASISEDAETGTNDENSEEDLNNKILDDPNYPTHLLTSSLDNTIKVWDVKTGKCIRTQFGHIEGVWSIAADTFRIVSGAHDRLIKVWDLQSGKCMHTFGGNSAPISCVALGDSRFVSGLENGRVKMYCFDDV
ncbi:unnamed protein product [Kuraishia capsulata CBS 1993]|uniref:F-box domain-containing protein n=1 Tax=Kuraishia capsulata CBS 1993 TaxID=1382522 RepID=W6MGY9_9ASCO|nr:uncharacterized protein KUCA_T00000855001 [Kuraishia capsulata CBS 1993]CDK24888.1 unnamed protein product [Kuraishia capsulata CBS 1993]